MCSQLESCSTCMSSMLMKNVFETQSESNVYPSLPTIRSLLFNTQIVQLQKNNSSLYEHYSYRTKIFQLFCSKKTKILAEAIQSYRALQLGLAKGHNDNTYLTTYFTYIVKRKHFTQSRETSTSIKQARQLDFIVSLEMKTQQKAKRPKNNCGALKCKNKVKQASLDRLGGGVSKTKLARGFYMKGVFISSQKDRKSQNGSFCFLCHFQ